MPVQVTSHAVRAVGRDVARHDRQWLRRLRAVDTRGTGRAVSSQLLLVDVESATGRGAVEWALEAAQLLLADLPPSSLEVGPRSLTDGRFAEALALWAVLALAGADALPPSLVTEFRGLVAEFVEVGVSLDFALRCVRVAHAHLTQSLFQFCERRFQSREQAALMRQISADMFDGMEVIASALSRWFAIEHAQRTEPSARRAALLNTVLAGDPVTPDVSTRLGYDLSARHLALVLWCEEHSGDCAAQLEETASLLLKQAGCASILMFPAGAGRLSAWGTLTGEPDRDLSAVAGGLAGHAHVAVGLPGDGIAGFRSSHAQALDVERVARLAGSGAGTFHDYAELDLAVLLGDDLRATAEFVERELGPLAADDRNTAVLRETIKCYLDHERSLAATATSMHVAKNTVTYRIKKVERLLGRTFPRERRRLHFHMALHVAEVFGPAVLSHGAKSRATPDPPGSARRGGARGG